ncbi:hypothetical protein HYC85_032206 [Camellia sinensis]|uniref:Uncharacterized protein n=1 Tax=Camellia sinensis TaxID=4442 RepID=A0A7J7FSH8_CAMSI|nr:hypothetical protein HYC85_032206 [Camellia sinensis]
MVKLATQSFEHKPAYQLVDEGIKELRVKVNNMIKGVGNFDTKELNVDDPNFTQVKGIKKKDVGYKGRGRLKPWHEMMNKKTKVISQPALGISLHLAGHNPMETEPFFRNESSFDFSIYSEPPHKIDMGIHFLVFVLRIEIKGFYNFVWMI